MKDYTWSGVKSVSSTSTSNVSNISQSQYSGGGGKSCYHSHKPLPLGDGLVIYGGSCISPAVSDADIYIGFDAGMKVTNKHFPWTPGHWISMPITDRDVPKELGDFMKLIEWTIEQIKAGKKVHAGCIGGHGRTGLFFTALVATMMDNPDAAQYVRDNYCGKAVESQKQVDWLKQYFGVNPVKPRDAEKADIKPAWKSNDKATASPIKSTGCIFGSWI